MKKEIELYKLYRPKTFKEVLGQKAALSALSTLISLGKVPRALLFTGPSGCGKTTLARILARKLKCGLRYDLQEFNTANFRGIDTVRGISSCMHMAPIEGPCRIWIIDEAHKMTGDAGDAMLKILEDTPGHCYFFLCTTNPQKLSKPIRTRCTEIAVKSLSSKDIENLILETCKKEKKKLPEDVVEAIVDCCEGSARKAMVFLHSVIEMDDEDDMLELIQPPTMETDSIEIARALINSRTNWTTMANILKGCDLKEAEGIRRLVMAYTSKVMLGGGKNSGQCFAILSAFEEPFYNSGQGGLMRACYEVVEGGE